MKNKNNQNKKKLIKKNQNNNSQFLNKSNEGYKNYNNQNVNEYQLILNRYKNENQKETLFYQQINDPMINGNGIFHVNKKNEELNGNNYMNIPYNNIGIFGNQIIKDNNILKIKENKLSYINYNLNDKVNNNSFNQFQLNISQDTSNINKHENKINEIYINDKNYNNKTLCNLEKNYYPNKLLSDYNFLDYPIYNQSSNDKNNINKKLNINDDIIGIDFSLNNNLNNILPNKNNKKDIKNIKDECIINSKCYKNNMIINNVKNIDKKRYILMSEILSNYPPKINYKFEKKEYINLVVKKENSKEDIIYYLFENDIPNEIVQKICKDNNIINQNKILKLTKIIENGLKVLKEISSYKLLGKTVKILNIIKNQIYEKKNIELKKKVSNSLDYSKRKLNVFQNIELNKKFVNSCINIKTFILSGK